MTPFPKQSSLGGSFGDYQLKALLASDEATATWLASSQEYEDDDTELVLKILRPEWASDPNFVGLFLSEARAAANLNHPNIARIFDLGEAAGIPFLAMEHVEGHSLRHLLEAGAGQGLPAWVGLHLLNEVLAGLAHAHGNADEQHTPLGLIHEEVAPDNIMITDAGEVKLLNLGVTRVTTSASWDGAGVLHGYPAYCSPEQARGGEVDARSDLYAAGVILHELLIGRPPFQAESEEELLARVMAGMFRPPRQLKPDLPGDLEQILRRSMAVDPEQRYQTAGGMMADLAEARGEHGHGSLPQDLADFVGAAIGGGAFVPAPRVELIEPAFDEPDIDGQPTPVVDLQLMASMGEMEPTPIVETWQQRAVLNSVRWEAPQDTEALAGIPAEEVRAAGEPPAEEPRVSEVPEDTEVLAGPEEDSVSQIWSSPRRPGPEPSMAKAWDAPARATPPRDKDPWERYKVARPPTQPAADPFTVRGQSPDPFASGAAVSSPPRRGGSRPVEKIAGFEGENARGIDSGADMFHQPAAGAGVSAGNGNIFSTSRAPVKEGRPSHTEYAFFRKRSDKSTRALTPQKPEAPRPAPESPPAEHSLLSRRVPTQEEKRARRRLEAGFEALRQGDRETARSEWEQAVALDPKNKVYQFNLRRLQNDDPLAGDGAVASPDGEDFPWKKEE